MEWKPFNYSINNIDIGDLYDEYLTKYYSLKLDDYQNIQHPIFRKLTNHRLYIFIRYSEFNFVEEKEKLFCQELLNTQDKNNIILACNILVKLTLIQ